MRYFCSKDCPDCCEFDIVSGDGGKVEFKGISRSYADVPFVCTKLKDFYDRELLETPSFYTESGHRVTCDGPSATTAFSESLLNLEGSNILYMRGSGSLGYMMGAWDQLMSQVPGCYFIEGNPCDETGSAAHEKDFGVCVNPPHENLENVSTIVIFGRNAKVTSPHLYAYLKRLKKMGKKIIYIDPIRTETVAIADHYIRIAPGMDGMLAAGLLNLLGKGAGPNVDKIIDKTSVTKDDLDLLTATFENGPVGVITGFGLQRYTNGMNTVQWINRLAVETGNEPYLYYGRGSKSRFHKWATADHGAVNIGTILNQLESGFFDMMVIVGANPVMTFPESVRWQELLKSIQTVVVDTHQTQTAECADIFVRVGGMFCQQDAQGSYFFMEEAKRERFRDDYSDLDMVEQLSKLLNKRVSIPDISDIEPELPEKERQFDLKPIAIKEPKAEQEGMFRLMTGSAYHYLNSQVPEKYMDKDNVVFLSLADSVEFEFSNGDDIELFNDTGRLQSTVQISDKVAKGVLLVYKNRPSAEGWTNMLIEMALTDSGEGLSYYDTFVRIRKI